MTLTHEPGRTLVDTQAMAMIAGRSAWSVRTLCVRGEHGYDVDACALELSKDPAEPVLVTAAQAQRYLGIPAGNVRIWAFRRRLTSHARDGRGSPLYDAVEVCALAVG